MSTTSTTTSPVDSLRDTDFFKEMVRQMRALDSYGQFDGQPAERLLDPFILTKERNRVLPEVPTLNETVMPGFDILAWAGMFGPANLPPEIVKVLADAVQKALSTPLVIERLNAGGTEVFWSGPQEFSEFVKAELVKWTAAIKEAGIEPE